MTDNELIDNMASNLEKVLIFAAFCLGWQVYHFGIGSLLP